MLSVLLMISLKRIDDVNFKVDKPVIPTGDISWTGMVIHDSCVKRFFTQFPLTAYIDIIHFNSSLNYEMICNKLARKQLTFNNVVNLRLETSIEELRQKLENSAYYTDPVVVYLCKTNQHLLASQYILHVLRKISFIPEFEKYKEFSLLDCSEGHVTNTQRVARQNLLFDDGSDEAFACLNLFTNGISSAVEYAAIRTIGFKNFVTENTLQYTIDRNKLLFAALDTPQL